MSRHDINVPLFALTPSNATRRKAALYRNVTTFDLPHSTDRDFVLREAEMSCYRRVLFQR
jgi:pyruvate kinase